MNRARKCRAHKKNEPTIQGLHVFHEQMKTFKTVNSIGSGPLSLTHLRGHWSVFFEAWTTTVICGAQ